MKLSKKIFIAAALFTILGVVIGLGIATNFNIQTSGYAQDANISKESIDILTKAGQAMAEVTAAAKPAVVNIASTQTIKTQGIPSPFFNDPFFRHFFGDEFGFNDKPKERKQSGLGSGVIVDKDGYIITNNHVVRNATEIKVKLSDKREFKGKIIGSDPKTDIAVIKIDAKDLPVIKIGDSEKLKVGETVIAIGNLYGLNQTVTYGIVSATGRANVGIADYEDFIQTDAAINPGNSGGALVNVRGELVGINTAIFSTSGGYQGIGFAIPSNMVKVVMDSLIKKGKVVRGWLGVSIQPMTPELAKQFKISDEKGALVGDVFEDSPAEKAGIKTGDVIVEYNGKKVDEPSGLRNMVAGTSPNEKALLKIIRDGKQVEVSVVIVEQPSNLQKLQGKFENYLKGIHVQNLTPEIRSSLEIPKRVTGVIITDIDAGSPAEGVLMRNDIILEINKNRISSTKSYESVASKIKPDQNVLLLVFRNGAAIYITLSNR